MEQLSSKLGSKLIKIAKCVRGRNVIKMQIHVVKIMA